MAKLSGSFTNKRGNKLYTAEWTPDEGQLKAIIFWIHGFGEYIDRIEDTAKAWTSAGIAVYGFDTHGMGLSEPQDLPSRGLIRRFSHLVDDAVQYLTEVLKPSLAAKGVKPPVFVGGNSLGGLVASYVVLAAPEDIAGLIMQSPAVDVEWTRILRVQAAMGNMLAAIVPRAKMVPAVRPEDMSQDPDVVKAYLADPLIYQGNVKALTGNEILKGFRAITARRKEFKLPIFAVHGTSDRCTSLPALRQHLKHVSSTDVTLREVDGGYHELLHGPEKDDVRGAIRDWVLDHSAAAPAPTAPEPADPAPAVPGPAVPEPAVPEPAVPEPAVPEPAVPEPAVPEPAVPEPAVPEPAVPEPAVPEPAAAAPAVPEPAAAAPADPAPAETQAEIAPPSVVESAPNATASQCEVPGASTADGGAEQGGADVDAAEAKCA